MNEASKCYYSGDQYLEWGVVLTEAAAAALQCRCLGDSVSAAETEISLQHAGTH